MDVKFFGCQHNPSGKMPKASSNPINRTTKHKASCRIIIHEVGSSSDELTPVRFLKKLSNDDIETVYINNTDVLSLYPFLNSQMAAQCEVISDSRSPRFQYIALPRLLRRGDAASSVRLSGSSRFLTMVFLPSGRGALPSTSGRDTVSGVTWKFVTISALDMPPKVHLQSMTACDTSCIAENIIFSDELATMWFRICTQPLASRTDGLLESRRFLTSLADPCDHLMSVAGMNVANQVSKGHSTTW